MSAARRIGSSSRRCETPTRRPSPWASSSIAFALIKGSASFGYRDFQPLSPSLPAYQGAIANADLSYVAFGTTRLGVQAMRDVQYSFDINEPYYLLTGVSVSLARRIFAARRRRRALRRAEARPTGIASAWPSRRGTESTTCARFGGGIGYHMANGRAHRVQRRSAAPDLAGGEPGIPRPQVWDIGDLWPLERSRSRLRRAAGRRLCLCSAWRIASASWRRRPSKAPSASPTTSSARRTC